MNLEKLSSIKQSICASHPEGNDPIRREIDSRCPTSGFGLAFALVLLFFSASSAISHGADAELTNYKSGISLDFTAPRGSAFAEEYFYYDKVLDDRKVVYLKAGTGIVMEHNERNIAGAASGTDAYEGVGLTVGQIRYKLDGDQYRGPTVNGWTAYSGMISFSDMNYAMYGAAGTPAVGTVGPTGGELTEANKSTRYHRGILDSVGDEWHTLTVADDDSAYTPNSEFRASDGKIWYFVVNPKTPCLTWRTSGSGQFYTTPPKKYFFPIIYDQTTYISGAVSCEIRDINGNKVFYRINGGSFIDAGSSAKVLTQDSFNNGENTLEYYYDGKAANKKTRIVVKNPGYPSAQEAHGDRLWKNAALWESEVKPRIAGDQILSSWRNYWRTDDRWNNQTGITNGSRKGYRNTADTSFEHAFTARWEGMTFMQAGYTHSAADLARLALFDTRINLDPIGYELNTWSNNPIPSREIIYRGYYDVLDVYAAAATYDVLIGYYRANQGYVNGITPIQDYFIRDVLAKWVHNANLIQAGYTAAPLMWPTAHVTGATMIACMMPSYSSPYYGTCGLDGNTTVYPWAPFKDANYTWKQLFLTRDVPVTGYPNCASLALPEDMFNSEGKWIDRIPYVTTHLYGNCIAMQYNLVKLFVPGVTYPKMNMAMTAAAAGGLYGLKFTTDTDRNPVFSAWVSLQNTYFRAFRDVARPRMLAFDSANLEGINKQIMNARPFSMIFYNHALPLGDASLPGPTRPSSPQGLKVVNP